MMETRKITNGPQVHDRGAPWVLHVVDGSPAIAQNDNSPTKLSQNMQIDSLQPATFNCCDGSTRLCMNP